VKIFGYVGTVFGYIATVIGVMMIAFVIFVLSTGVSADALTLVLIGTLGAGLLTVGLLIQRGDTSGKQK
jgi:hypothetical protein